MHFYEADPDIYKYEAVQRPVKRKGYWFPYFCKYVAWIITIIVAIVCFVILALYGITFGVLKCFLWFTALLLSIAISLMLIQPCKIAVFSLLLSKFGKAPFLRFKKIPEKYLHNPYDERKAFLAIRRRLDNTPYYEPLPRYKLESRAENVKYHMEQRKLFIDLCFFILFAFVVAYILTVHEVVAKYQSTEVVKNLLVHGHYTHTIPLTEVSTYWLLMEYFRETFLPALFGETDDETSYIMLETKSNSPDSFVHPWSGKRKKSVEERRKYLSPLRSPPEWDKSSLTDLIRRFERQDQNSDNVTDVFQRSWTMERNIKLIGKPRLRQLRVKSEKCRYKDGLEPRREFCAPEFNLFNQETRDFSLWWEPYKENFLTPAQQKPWNYESIWTSGGILVYGKLKIYPAGGYILEMGKNIDDCKVILEFIDAFEWIDLRTRAVIVELTLYNVNVNMFSVVHLILERTPSGVYIPGYHIETSKLLFLSEEIELGLIFFLFLLYFMLLCIIVREINRIRLTSFSAYLSEGSPCIEILIIILGVLSFIFLFVRSFYVSHLLKIIEESQNNDFVSFAYASVWERTSVCLYGILIILAAIRLLQLLKFNTIFFYMLETLRGSYRYFIALCFIIVFTLIAFSLFFHISLAAFDEHYRTLFTSFTTLVGVAFCLDDNYDRSMFREENWFLVHVLYIVYFLFVIFIIYSFFVAVICYFMTKVKRTPMRSKYSAFSYLNYETTATKRADIMRLRGGCSDIGSPLRIRGGGQLCSCCCKNDKVSFDFPPKNNDGTTVVLRSMPKITKRNDLNFIPSCRLTNGYRFEAMRYATQAHLEDNPDAVKKNKENEMKALVVSELKRPRIGSTEFYRVKDGDTRCLVEGGRLLEMKKKVDDYGEDRMKKKFDNAGIELKVNVDEDYSKNVTQLNLKLSELSKEASKQYKRESIEKKRR